MKIRSYATVTFVLAVALLTCTNRIGAENLKVRVRALSLASSIPESPDAMYRFPQGTQMLLEVDAPMRLALIDGDASQIVEMVDSNGNDFWPASLKIPQENPELVKDFGPRQNGFQSDQRFWPEENSNRFLIGLHAFGQPSDGSTSFTLKAILVGVVPSEKIEKVVAEEVLMKSMETFIAGGHGFEFDIVSFGGYGDMGTTTFNVNSSFQATAVSIVESEGHSLGVSATNVKVTKSGFKFSVKGDYYNHEKTVKLELTGNPPVKTKFAMEVPVSIGLAE
jgi:hypothetical protein